MIRVTRRRLAVGLIVVPAVAVPTLSIGYREFDELDHTCACMPPLPTPPDSPGAFSEDAR